MKRNISCISVLFLLVSVFLISTTAADIIETTTSQITSSMAYETFPTIGHNDVTNTDYVVYTLRPALGGGMLGPGDIWYQPLSNGAPIGLPVQVTSSTTDDQLNDCSGDYIVYTAYDSTTSISGSIMLYQISNGARNTLGTATVIQEPKIHGDRVVWREGGALSATIMYYELNWIPLGNTPIRLAGPVPPTFDVQIGSRFAVWAELIDGHYIVNAYDFDMLSEMQITEPDTTTDNRQPATSGPWIVWQHQGVDSSIKAFNMDTLERRTITDNVAGNHFNPSIDSDIIGWESVVDGNLDIWIYSISRGESFQVTTDTADQYLNDVFGDMVAYADMSGGSEDVYLSYWGEIRTPGYQPSGITYDGTYLYVSEMSGLRKISKLSPTGVLVGTDQEFLAPSPTGFDGLGNPNGLAYDGSGRLFVSDLGEVLYEIDTAGTTIINEFVLPFRGGGVAFDGTNIYVSDVDTETILVMDRAGNTINNFNSPIRPAGMTYDASTGHLLVISEFDHQISKITTDGQLICSVDGPRDPGIQGLGGITIVGSELYIAEVTDPDPFNPPEISGTIYRVPIPNCPPIADSGPDQTVHPGTTVTLDGSASSDPEENYPLTYAWEFTSYPGASPPLLTGDDTVNPSFHVDMAGEYVIQLKVTDSLGVESAPDEVRLSTVNTQPVAEAGPDQSVTEIGTVVSLDGTASDDLDGDPLTYSWTFTTKPAGSTATLDDPTSATPSFTVDMHGVYIIELVVSDPWEPSTPDEVIVSFENVKPVAEAGLDQAVSVGDTVHLDGTGSHDANNDELTSSWNFVSTPDGSGAALDDSTSVSPSFVADLEGTYIVSLIVNDGFVDSDPDIVIVVATSTNDQLVQKLQEAQETINNLDLVDFKNKNWQKIFGRKINQVIAKIVDGDYQEALDKLENDILAKTDGCAETGSPDQNDKITNCNAQNQVYPLLMEAIELLEQLV